MDFLADTSYKQSQAEVIGQLTAAPVATGSQLVGYSGFSNEAFIREPYSSDLDFGTGEWSAGAWVNVPVTLPLSNFPVVSGELVSNGGPNFTDSTGWAVQSGATLSVVNGKLRLEVPDPSFKRIWTGISTVVGKTYVVLVSGTLVSGSQPGAAKMDDALGQGNAVYGSLNSAFAFVATATTSYIVVVAANAAVTYDVSSVTVKEIASTRIAERTYSSGSTLNFGLMPLGNLTATASDGITTRTVTTSSAYNTGTWLKVDAYYKTNGSLSIAVNGQQMATTGAQTPLLTLNNSNAVLTIGNNYGTNGQPNAPFPGSISLLKLSATVPTTEQLQWTYEQEKALFSANALCTLPDSNTVSDLTFDDKTNRLIAVSSANESYWSGLTRVYTEAVTSGGSLGKVVSTSNVHLVSRSTVNPGVDVTLPAYNIKAHLESDRTEATIKPVVVFDFDPVDNSQTAFVLPIGYSAVAVYKAGTELRETITTAKDWSRSFDGFKETITLTTAPGTTNWIQIHAVKE